MCICMGAEDKRKQRLITIMTAFQRLEDGKSFDEDSLIQTICFEFGVTIKKAREYLDDLCNMKRIFRHNGLIEINREFETQNDMIKKFYPNGVK